MVDFLELLKSIVHALLIINKKIGKKNYRSKEEKGRGMGEGNESNIFWQYVFFKSVYLVKTNNKNVKTKRRLVT